MHEARVDRAALFFLLVFGLALFGASCDAASQNRVTDVADARAASDPEGAPDAHRAAESGVDAASDAPADGHDAAPETGCVSLGSGSSGTGTSCEAKASASCDGVVRSITCTCPLGACTCADGTTFAHDCTQGCSPRDSERASCGVPSLPQNDAGGSSSGGGT